MRKISIILVMVGLLFSLLTPLNTEAFSVNKDMLDNRVLFEIMYNDDKGKGKIKGYNNEILLMKNYAISGEVALTEPEHKINVKIFINGEEVPAEAYDRHTYHYQQGFFDHLEEWNANNSRTDSDHIRVVATSVDEAGNVIEEKEVFNQTITSYVPTAAEFCKSPRSYMHVSAPMQLCDEIKQQQIEENKQDIEENKEDIEKNTEDIEENKEDIEENKENIEKNADEIDKVKEDLEEVKATVLELQSEVTGLEAQVQEVVDEVNGLKSYVLSFAEVQSENVEEGFTPSEIWYRELVEEADVTEETVSFLEKIFSIQKVHAAEDDWFREKWDVNSELTFNEGQNYEVMLVSEDAKGNENIEGYEFYASKDGLEMEQTDSKGPFEVLEEEPEQEEEVEEIASAPAGDEGSTSAFTIFSLVLGVIGVLVLGVVIGLYVAKRKEIQAIFKK
jgi:flagellar motility protein MotE (MotC chaperone)